MPQIRFDSDLPNRQTAPVAIQVLPEPKEPRDRLVAALYVLLWTVAIGVLLYAGLTGRLF